MTAPDAQPPPAGVWWSAKHNAIVAKHPYGECYDLIEQDGLGWRDTEELSALPADAVRLVPAVVQHRADVFESAGGFYGWTCTCGAIARCFADKPNAALSGRMHEGDAPASAALDGTPGATLPSRNELARAMDPIAYDDRAVPQNLGQEWDRDQRRMTAELHADRVLALLASTPTRTEETGHA